MPNQIRSWEENYEALLEYRRVHGDCMVPLRFSGDKILGKWVSTQRESRYVLKPERKALLDQIGFEWHPRQRRSDDKWNGMFARLLAFRERGNDMHEVFNHCNDPELVKWCCNQREYSSRGLLVQERYDRLRQIKFPVRPIQSIVHPKRDDCQLGGAFSPESFSDAASMSANNIPDTQKVKIEHVDNTFNTKATELPVTLATPDDTSIASVTADDNIGQFPIVPNQKQQTASGNNTAEVASSNSPCFATNRRRSWLESYAALKDFKRHTGHCRVPIQYKHDKQLGIWVGEQRKKKFLMSDERRQKLERLGFTWANPRGKQWTTTFQKLKAYRKENPDCYKPKNFNLKKWLEGQKHAVLNGTLDKHCVDQLKSIGYDWQQQHHHRHSPEVSDASLASSSSQGSLGAAERNTVATKKRASPVLVPLKKRRMRVSVEPNEPLTANVVSPESSVATPTNSLDKGKAGAAMGAAESLLFLAGNADKEKGNFAEDSPPQKQSKLLTVEHATTMVLPDHGGPEALTVPHDSRLASGSAASEQHNHHIELMEHELETTTLDFLARRSGQMTPRGQQLWINEAMTYHGRQLIDAMTAQQEKSSFCSIGHATASVNHSFARRAASSTTTATSAELLDLRLADFYLSQVGRIGSARR